MVNKRGQLFLLAAVIISAVVLSLGITANQARVNREPGNFYDFTYEVKKETGAVVDYDIYTDINGGSLEEFIEKIANDTKDKDADAEFMFIYGNSTELTMKNYGKEDVGVNDNTLSGSSAIVVSKICSETSCVSTDADGSDYDEEAGILIIPDEGEDPVESIDVTIGGGEITFPISDHRQVIFLIQKEVDGENFVAIG